MCLNELYVIGINDFDFIKITYEALMYDGKKMWHEIQRFEYGVPVNEAAIIPDYETAEKILKEIQDNVEKINVSNNDIIGEIIDKNDGFDKKKYISELKIYRLVPTPIYIDRDDKYVAMLEKMKQFDC